MLATADICDDHADEIDVAEPIFSDFGGRARFSGPVTTLKTYEDNALIRSTLEEAGEGRVFVIDGGGSLRCALVGDRLAGLARERGWAGLVVYGCIRDRVTVALVDIGVKALGTNPRRSAKQGLGQRDVPVTFARVTFNPASWVYADPDGIVLAPRRLD